MDNNVQNDNNFTWPKKRKKQQHKKEVIKAKKLKGLHHINHVGKEIIAKQLGPNCRCKRFNCFDITTQAERQKIFEEFYNMESKNVQDTYLVGLLTVEATKQRRSRKQQNEQDIHNNMFVHEAAFYYKIRITKEGVVGDIQICQKAFMSIHGITRGRLRNTQKCLLQNINSPKDGRGFHDNRPTKLPEPVKKLVEHHIQTFKPRVSHYSFRNNPNKRYLPEQLNIKLLHEMFLSDYQINVPYRAYTDIFNTFNISFGYPKSDTCSNCDRLKIAMQVCPLEQHNVLKTELELHLRKADSFHVKKRAYKRLARKGKVTVITFDYMQNLPCPKLETNAIFYARQMWQYVFGIHDLSNKAASMFCYNETVAKKGQNEVTSFLFNFLKNHQNLKKDLILISDGAAGQNKNFVMMFFLYMLVHTLKMFRTITYLFPTRGHSFLPNDTDFALIANKKKKLTVEVPNEWNTIIRSARNNPTPFDVIEVDQTNVFDVKTTVEKYFKKSRAVVKLKGLKMYQIKQSSNLIFLRDTYKGPWRSTLLRNNTQLPREMEFQAMYNGRIPLKKAKADDLKSLYDYITPQSRAFYDSLIVDNGDHDPDMSESDNSSGDEMIYE